MSPKRIVKKVKIKMLDMIGICDHNSCENVQATINAAQKNLNILPGIEICTKEEIHILALFDKISDAEAIQNFIYKNLPDEKNNPEVFGEQIIVNEYDEIEGLNERLLIGACNLTVKEVVDKIHELHGLAIASHIDRESFSLIGQLGFIPADLKIDAIEISANMTVQVALTKFPEIEKYPIIKTSDAHSLDDIGKSITKFLIAEATIKEIKKAFNKKDGRKMSYE